MLKRIGMAGAAALAFLATLIAPAAADDIATPAMWRVSDDDSEFILLGTFHILPPGLNWRSDALQAAIDNADVVYFEVDADAPDAKPKTLNVLMTQGFNPQGTTLSGMLEDADAEKLKEVSQQLGLPFAAVDPMRPWQAFLTLSVQFIIKQGFQPGHGVDNVLLAETRTLGKDVRFFETIEDQLALFTTLDPATEKELLVVTLRDWDAQAAAFDDLFNAWKTGDVDFIDALMNEDMRKEAPEVFDKLIVKRNEAWADEIARVMKEGSGKGLVAVGAAHLVGDKHSVPALLKAKGFKVTRYSLDGEVNAAPKAANDNNSVGENDAGNLLKKAGEN